MQLPGVGPVLAKTIITTREVQGGFRCIHGLSDVKGMGPRRLQQLEAYLSFDGYTALQNRRQRQGSQ